MDYCSSLNNAGRLYYINGFPGQTLPPSILHEKRGIMASVHMPSSEHTAQIASALVHDPVVVNVVPLRVPCGEDGRVMSDVN